MNALLSRVAGISGIAGALLLWVFGLIHPKGRNDVGAMEEWMTRVAGSDAWTVVHLMLLLAAILALFALLGIRHSYPEERAETWARLGLAAAVVATGVAVTTFLVDGAALKQFADLWVDRRAGTEMRGAAELMTAVGFVLVAGLQISKGIVGLLFGAAGLSTRAHPAWLGWLAMLSGVLSLVPGAMHYLTGTSTATVSFVYVSEALFGVWVFAMSWRLLRSQARHAGAPGQPPRTAT